MAALLEHTSDIAILAKGYRLEEVYADALRQMNEVLLPGHCEGPRHYDCQMHLCLRGEDPTALLIDFLSDVLALTYIQKAIFCEALFESLSRREVAVDLFGRWYGRLENEIKAVTYHEAHLSRDPFGKWTTPVLFDL